MVSIVGPKRRKEIGVGEWGPENLGAREGGSDPHLPHILVRGGFAPTPPHSWGFSLVPIKPCSHPKGL